MADAVAEVDPQGGRTEQGREDEQPELDAGELKEEDRATLSPCGGSGRWAQRPGIGYSQGFDKIATPGTERAVMGAHFPVSTYMTKGQFEKRSCSKSNS
jgi:hypothetical protein